MTTGETGSLEADREVVVGFRLRIGCTHRKAWSRPSDSGRLLRVCSVIQGFGSCGARGNGAGQHRLGAGVGGGGRPAGGQAPAAVTVPLPPNLPAPKLPGRAGVWRWRLPPADAGASFFLPSGAPCRDPLRGSGRLGCSQLTCCWACRVHVRGWSQGTSPETPRGRGRARLPDRMPCPTPRDPLLCL